MIKRVLFILFSIGVFTLSASAQANASREDLQKQEQTIRKELDELNQLLEQTKRNKKNSLGQLEAIRSKIAKRQALINGIAKQVKILDDAIYNNQLDVQRLNKDLDTLKKRYQKSIIFAYKSRSGYEYLNFLFSANSFNDAVKRITYLKSYRQNREAQANAIDLSQTDLNAKINVLGANKKDRLKTLEVQHEQLKVLVVDKKEQDKIVNQLKSKEQEITAQVRQKEAQRRKMQSALLTIIRRETLEAERKEKDRLAKAKAANEAAKATAKNNTEEAAPSKTSSKNAKVGNIEGGLTSTTDNRPYSALETTEEGREASILFENNKGNLPWPVDKGNVYIHFGVAVAAQLKVMRQQFALVQVK